MWRGRHFNENHYLKLYLKRTLDRTTFQSKLLKLKGKQEKTFSSSLKPYLFYVENSTTLLPGGRNTEGAVTAVRIPCPNTEEISVILLELRQSYSHGQLQCLNMSQGLPVLGRRCFSAGLVAIELVVLDFGVSLWHKCVHRPREYYAHVRTSHPDLWNRRRLLAGLAERGPGWSI